MKKYLLILFFIPSIFFSQKYIILDSLQNFKIKKYTLQTKEIYNIDKKIEMYNIFVSENNILLFSILPDLETEPIRISAQENLQNWTPVHYENIIEDILTNGKLKDLVLKWNAENEPENKTMEYKLVKKHNGKYYVSRHCLTEFFSISNLKLPLVSKYGVINIKDQKVTIKQMQSSFKQQLPNDLFILDVRNENFLRDEDVKFAYRNYLSKEITVNNKQAYKFWTFDGWWNNDGYNIHRGIDRFLYIPNEGIVGGSYDFYFRLKPKISTNEYYTISTKKLWENIINDKIMIAKELHK